MQLRCLLKTDVMEQFDAPASCRLRTITASQSVQKAQPARYFDTLGLWKGGVPKKGGACESLRLSPCVLVQPDGWARGEREGYGGPRDVTSLSLSKRTLLGASKRVLAP